MYKFKIFTLGDIGKTSKELKLKKNYRSNKGWKLKSRLFVTIQTVASTDSAAAMWYQKSCVNVTLCLFFPI